MRITSMVASALLLAGVSSAASATVVAEIEPNDSFATAQNLDGQFTTGSDANVVNADTVPYVTVLGQPGQNYDFYSFTVGQAGSSGTFDIDFGEPDFDPYIAIFDSAQNRLIGSDDGGVIDSGSVHPWDTLFNYTFADAGLYYLRVGTCCNDVASTGDYQLHVSLESPGSGAVPEPSTWAMMLLGFGAAGVSLRRRTPRKPLQVA
ncbi:MAG TPA: DVUA0089 family protein [Sphingomicrobium sp.]|nr:DVUA0089 family protein [Sphingomicrobium sp.]